ncbi:MAG: hypothetical protein FJ098_08360, partial [Deltaproteobacteria bacterium]|nr:hypothetical protein [Deltaproteobacteria bacterium]
MRTWRSGGWSWVLVAGMLTLAGAGCSEQAADVDGPRDVAPAEDTEAVFQDILVFLDAYASRGLAAGSDPTLVIVSPQSMAKFELLPAGTEVTVLMQVENWDYPDPGSRSILCSVDGGAYTLPPWQTDGFTETLEYPFEDVPHGMHRLCCTLAEGGEELSNCAATACVDVVVWQLCDYLTDPVCNDQNPASAETCLWDAALQHRVCVYAKPIAVGVCLSPYNCECTQGTGFQLCIDGQCQDCVTDAHCDDQEPCTTDTCVDNVCVHQPVSMSEGICCSSVATGPQVCADGKKCTVDSCVAIDPVTGRGHCSNVHVGPPCCDSHVECQDDDPCTANACISGECRLAPSMDPLCCNPAHGSADCETGDPCVHAACDPTLNQCVWTPLTIQEQLNHLPSPLACCGSHADCQEGGLWEEMPQDAPSTLDFCQNGQCVHVIDPSYCECNEGQGCAFPCVDDGESCTSESCNLVTNFCTHTPVPGCCDGPDNCSDQDYCTTDACVGGFCQNLPVTNCCNTHADCDDGIPCNLDACISKKCHHGANPAFPGCCTSNADCNDNNTCTTEVCHTGTYTCQKDVADPPPPGKECCLVAENCDEGNPTAQAVCYKNVCKYFQVSCVPGDSCNDNQPCTLDSCNGSTLKCENVWQEGCCSSNLACNLPPLMPETPEYLCKEGTCNLALPVPACVFTEISSCCQVNADCNDGQACTTDYCVNKKCKYVADPDCCTSSAACNDGNACTVDSCSGNPGTCVNVADPTKPGTCCDNSGQCADSDPCTTELCVNHYCHAQTIQNCCTPANEDEVCP